MKTEQEIVFVKNSTNIAAIIQIVNLILKFSSCFNRKNIKYFWNSNIILCKRVVVFEWRFG